MNKVLGIVLMLLPSMAFSQWSLMNESFDEYNVGDLLSNVGASNGWGLWTGLDAESCVVSTDQFLSGTNSGHVFDDGTTNTRATWSWSDYIEGKYSFYANIFIPEDSDGGFIGFHDSLNLEMPHSISILGDSALLFLDWEAFEYLEADNLSAGEWHEIHLIFDLDNFKIVYNDPRRFGFFILIKNKSMLKLVVKKIDDKILGCHMFGDASSEIIQMASVALNAGVTKKEFDMTMALHPTVSEEFVTMY